MKDEVIPCKVVYFSSNTLVLLPRWVINAGYTHIMFTLCYLRAIYFRSISDDNCFKNIKRRDINIHAQHKF